MQPIDPILNPTIFLGSFEFREPVTTLTDFLTALVAWYAFYRLQTYRGEKPKHFILYKAYFLAFAIGMTSAAWFGHGLQAYVGPELKVIGWVMSAFAFLMFGMATTKEVETLLPKWLISGIRIWMVVQFSLMVSMMIYPVTRDFVLPQINSTLFLIFMILPMHLLNYWKTKNRGSLMILRAIAFGIIPGLVYNNQISLNRWFNYHDISHVLMAIYMFLIYMAIRELTGVNRNQFLDMAE